MCGLECHGYGGVVFLFGVEEGREPYEEEERKSKYVDTLVELGPQQSWRSDVFLEPSRSSEQHPSFLFDSKGKAGEIETDRERGGKERKQRDEKSSWILL